jgi:hypothetical protein
MSKLQWFNLALRGLMEAGIVVAFAWWGYHVGETGGTRILYAILAPFIGFGFWGAVNFQQFGRMAETLRLIQEMVISLLAALAFYYAGAHVAGGILLSLSVVHHALVYLLGDTLLKEKSQGKNS